jgi:hypothetical protein
MLMILASSVALAVSAPVHSAEIAHPSRPYTATYHAQPTVHLEQVDPVPAMRQTHATCRWQAQLVINRAVASNGAPVPAIGKAIHSFRPLSGTYVGRCQDVEGRVAKDVARYSAAKALEAAQVAKADQAVLSAELDSLHALTTRG